MLEPQDTPLVIDRSNLATHPTFQCPTCGLKFQGQNPCRRCKTDLSLLLLTANRALRLRNQARLCMFLGEYRRAIEYAETAQSLHFTSVGNLILRLAKRMGRQT